MKMYDLKIIYFCTFVILFTIGNLLILLSYKPRGRYKVKLLLAFIAFNILSFLLMKVYCRDVSTGATAPKFFDNLSLSPPSQRSQLNFPLGYVPGL